jgi:hypothetical protein
MIMISEMALTDYVDTLISAKMSQPLTSDAFQNFKLFNEGIQVKIVNTQSRKNKTVDGNLSVIF